MIRFMLVLALLLLLACQSPINSAMPPGTGGSIGYDLVVNVTCDRDGLTYDIGTDDPGVLARVVVFEGDDAGDGRAVTATFSGSVLRFTSCKQSPIVGVTCCSPGDEITIVIVY